MLLNNCSSATMKWSKLFFFQPQNKINGKIESENKFMVAVHSFRLNGAPCSKCILIKIPIRSNIALAHGQWIRGSVPSQSFGDEAPDLANLS